MTCSERIVELVECARHRAEPDRELQASDSCADCGERWDAEQPADRSIPNHAAPGGGAWFAGYPGASSDAGVLAETPPQSRAHAVGLGFERRGRVCCIAAMCRVDAGGKRSPSVLDAGAQLSTRPVLSEQRRQRAFERRFHRCSLHSAAGAGRDGQDGACRHVSGSARQPGRRSGSVMGGDLPVDVVVGEDGTSPGGADRRKQSILIYLKRVL